jgi:methionine-rich copper-binding protein CopC
MTRRAVAERALMVLAAFLALGALATVGPVGPGPSVAMAHSTLIAASPGPGAIVGGSITTITLQYANEVVEFNGRVTRPDGTDVESSFEILNPTRVTITLVAPLDEPGEYAVRHATRSRDTDLVEAAFLFTYDPGAPPPEFLQVPSDDERPWWLWVIGIGGAAVVAVLTLRLIRSIMSQPTSSI